MRKPDPVEIVKVAAPVLAEAAAVILFIMMLSVWAELAAHGWPT